MDWLDIQMYLIIIVAWNSTVGILVAMICAEWAKHEMDDGHPAMKAIALISVMVTTFGVTWILAGIFFPVMYASNYLRSKKSSVNPGDL